MPFLSEHVYDRGLAVLDTEATAIHIVSAEPTNFATLNSLGSAAVSVGAPGARTGGGRKVTVAAVTNAAVTSNGTAVAYCIVDATNSRILVTAPLSASQAVVAGNTFSLPAFDVGIPAAV